METQSTPTTSTTSNANAANANGWNQTNTTKTTEVPTTTATKEFSKEAVDSATETTQETKEPKKYTFKRNGVEEEVDEDTYTKYAQKAWAADKTLAEAKKMQRELEAREAQILQHQKQIEEMRKLKPSQRVQQMLQELQENPEALTDFRGSIEQWLLQQIEEESASPEAQRALRAERELERIKRHQETEAEKQKQLAWQKAIEEQRPQQEKMIIDTLKVGGLPITEWNIKSIADVIYNARLRGHDPKPEQVAQVVKEDRIEHIKAFTSQYAKQIADAWTKKDHASIAKVGQALTDVVGEDIIKALRYYDMAMMEKKAPNLPKKVVETPKTEAPRTGAYEFQNYDEYLEYRKRNATQ